MGVAIGHSVTNASAIGVWPAEGAEWCRGGAEIHSEKHPILRTGGSNLSSSAGESGAAMAYPCKHLAGGSAPGEALSRLPLLG